MASTRLRSGIRRAAHGGAAVTLTCVALTSAAAPGASAAPAWLAPVNLSLADQDAVQPSVAADQQGDSLAAWTRFNGAQFIVQAALRPAGGAWPAASDLSLTGRDGLLPQVATDVRGDAVAVWQRSNGANSIVQASVRPAAGGAWQTPVDLSAPGQDAVSAQLAVDSQGDAVAVWQRSNGANWIMQAAVRPAGGGTWQPAIDLSLAGHDAGNAQVAMDVQGDAVATWQRFNGANWIIQAAVRLATSGTWQAPVDLSVAGQSANQECVATDSKGDAIVAWSRSNGANRIVQAAFRPVTSGVWQTPADLSAAGQDATSPSVSMDSQGNAVAAWQRFNGFNRIIQAAVRPVSSGLWQLPTNLSMSGLDAIGASVALDSHGDAAATWERFNGVNWIAQAATKPAALVAWQAPIDLSAGGQDASHARVVADSQGNALAVWQRSDGVHQIIQAAAYDAAGPLLRALSIPATGAPGQQLSFSVSPLDAWSMLGATTWSFGDGAVTPGTTVAHTYANAGTYQVQATSTDALGNATTQTGSVVIAAAPQLSISNFKQSRSTWRRGNRLPTISRIAATAVGTTYSFSLNQRANVRLAFTQYLPGRRVNGRCVTPTSRNRRRRACTRTATRGGISVAGHAGTNQVAFQGRLSPSTRLAPGSYSVIATATNAAGQKSKTKALSFRIAT